MLVLDILDLATLLLDMVVLDMLVLDILVLAIMARGLLMLSPRLRLMPVFIMEDMDMVLVLAMLDVVMDILVLDMPDMVVMDLDMEDMVLDMAVPSMVKHLIMQAKAQKQSFCYSVPSIGVGIVVSTFNKQEIKPNISSHVCLFIHSGLKTGCTVQLGYRPEIIESIKW